MGGSDKEEKKKAFNIKSKEKKLIFFFSAFVRNHRYSGFRYFLTEISKGINRDTRNCNISDGRYR